MLEISDVKGAMQYEKSVHLCEEGIRTNLTTGQWLPWLLKHGGIRKLNTSNWQAFFDAHAPHYMKNGFTRNTISEVDFLLQELGLSPGGSILDVGCGTGRHSIELAKRGFKMTGLDISQGMLAEAEKAAAAAGVQVEWVHSDAVTYVPEKKFDAVVCLCEGAFGLVGREEEPLEHDMGILRRVAAALKPQGRFILTTLNAYCRIRSLTQEDVDSGRFNPVTMVEQAVAEWELPEGKKQVEVKERRYFPFELQDMFAQAGLRVDHIWGGSLGKWELRQSIQLDAIEIMVTATLP